MTVMAPTRLVEADEALAIAEGLRAWAERTAGAVGSIRSYADVSAASVRSRHEKAAIEVPAGADSMLANSVAFTSTTGFDDFDDARRLGAFVVATRQVLDVSTTLMEELRSITAALTSASHQGVPTADAINRALELRDWARRSGFDQALADGLALILRPADQGRTVMAGLAYAWGCPTSTDDAPLTSSELAALAEVLAVGSDRERVRKNLVAQIKNDYSTLVDRKITSRLTGLSLDVLRQAIDMDGVRLAPLESAGCTNVNDVWMRRDRIAQIPGIGSSAKPIQLAASKLRTEIVDQERRKLARIDLNPDDQVLTRLLNALLTLLAFDEQSASAREFLDATVRLLTPWSKRFPTGETLLVHRTSPRRGRDLARYVGSVARQSQRHGLARIQSTQGGADVWAEFRRKSQQVYGLLGEIVGVSADLDAVQGGVSKQIAEQVNAQPLNLDLMRPATSLRGYQAFGAKFALVQRHVVIGDEMGLGKTVQALAAMAHLAQGGARHFLVVCPTGVLINWMKEVRHHTQLEPHRLHGVDRDYAMTRWRRHGGVAVTTYGTLRNLMVPTDVDISMFVADEAHLLKNPNTQQSQAAVRQIERSERALLLTGTPIENVVEDFKTLVGYLQPPVAKQLDTIAALTGADSFRQLVSPVYLRRLSEDVLAELPDLTDAEDWVDFNDAEDDAYFDAVADSQFPLMRRIAYVGNPRESSKTERIKELVDEAMQNGKKVLIFSWFHDVLDRLADELGDLVIGTIKGSVSADARQGLAEKLERSATPKVLLAQISAGGVGMNLQAASVVILCEPQVKPSLEDQAVKRAHRMGQVDKVVVHRILTPDSVDERLLEILAEKRRIIQEYVHTSEVAEATPEAKDLSDQEVTRRVLADEQARLKEKLRARPAAAAASRTSAEAAPGPAALKAHEAPIRHTTRSDDSRPFLQQGPGTPRDAHAASAPPKTVVDVCPSCDRPIDVLGHCACS